MRARELRKILGKASAVYIRVIYRSEPPSWINVDSGWGLLAYIAKLRARELSIDRKWAMWMELIKTGRMWGDWIEVGGMWGNGKKLGGLGRFDINPPT